MAQCRVPAQASFSRSPPKGRWQLGSEAESLWCLKGPSRLKLFKTNRATEETPQSSITVHTCVNTPTCRQTLPCCALWANWRMCCVSGERFITFPSVVTGCSVNDTVSFIIHAKHHTMFCSKTDAKNCQGGQTCPAMGGRPPGSPKRQCPVPTSPLPPESTCP